MAMNVGLALFVRSAHPKYDIRVVRDPPFKAVASALGEIGLWGSIVASWACHCLAGQARTWPPD